MSQKRNSRLEEILRDFREGRTDSELMERHRLSAGALQQVFSYLLETKAIEPADLHSRRLAETRAKGPDTNAAFARYASPVPIPIHELKRPEAVGMVVDIAEKGLKIRDIEARVGERKVFVIPADELVMIEPIVFDATCRWAGKDERGNHVAGFVVVRVARGDFEELGLLIQSMILDAQKLPDLYSVDFDRELATQTFDIGSLFTQDVTSSGSFNFDGINQTWFGKLIQALPIPCLLLDRWSNIVLANQSWGRISQDYEKIQGKPFSSLFVNRALATQADALAQRVYSTRRPESSQAVLEIEGKRIWGRMSLRSVRFGPTRLILVLVEDLTIEKQQLILKQRHEKEILGERNMLEERVTERTAELRRANELLRVEISERKRAQEEREKLIIDLQEALARVKTLSGLIPICASCKKIRDDDGYWQQIELYIRDHSEAEFSHGICPDCARRLYPEIYGDK